MSLADEARTVRERIAARLRELEPLVREYNELRQVAVEMGIEGSEPTPTQTPAPISTPARTAQARRAAPTATARQRKTQKAPDKGSQDAAAGELARRVLQAVWDQPGKTVADYAVVLEVAPAALYRPVRQLTTAGALVKRARQLHPG